MEDVLRMFNLPSGTQFENLTSDEQNTLMEWMGSLKEQTLTVDKIRQYVTTMKEAVEQELTAYNLDMKQDMFLKARLRNYMMLEVFLTSPDKAKKNYEAALVNLTKKR
jgi:phosphomevalonate kinase